MFSLLLLAGGWQTGSSMAVWDEGRLFTYSGQFYPVHELAQRNRGRSAVYAFLWCNEEAKRQAVRHEEEAEVPQRLIQTFIKT